MSEENNILYQKFLDKQLSEEDVIAFEQRLIDDAEFEEGFDLYVILDGHVEEKVKYGEAVGVLRGIGEKRRSGEDNTISLFRNKNLLVAASLLMAILLYFIISKIKSNNESKMPSYALVREEPTYPNKRNDSSELSNALEEFKVTKDIRFLDTINTIKNIDVNEKYYWLSEMHLMLNNTDSTLFYIKKLKPLKHKYQRILFLEALTYLKDKDQVEYTNFLNKYNLELDPYYHKKLNQ